MSRSNSFTSSFAEILSALTDGRALTERQMTSALGDMAGGRYTDAQIAAWLVALRTKGETAAEIADAARIVRENMVRFDSGQPALLDTCGTGGDGPATFNISTATAIVAAATGVPVVKHGNRAVSSRSGSVDVLQALGVVMDSDPNWLRQCLETAGIAFCYARDFHPAWSQVSAVRSQLGIRTLFNLVGPLANPAGARYQLLGVNRLELLDRLAEAMALLGTGHALVVCGEDGLDEVTLSARTHVRELRDGCVSRLEWSHDDFGLEACSLQDLYADGPEQSALRIREILAAKDSPSARVVLANVAAALFAANRTADLREGVGIAAKAISSGRARHVLDQLVACSQAKQPHV
jgi:anthranilate phosphoribosyltransferase